jgi:hypothetical protein
VSRVSYRRGWEAIPAAPPTHPTEEDHMQGALTEAAAVGDAIARSDPKPGHYQDVLTLAWELSDALSRAVRAMNRGQTPLGTAHIQAELNRRIALLVDLSGLLYAADAGDRVALGVLAARLDA